MSCSNFTPIPTHPIAIAVVTSVEPLMIYLPCHIQNVILSIAVNIGESSALVSFYTWEVVGFPNLDDNYDKITGFDGSIPCNLGSFTCPIQATSCLISINARILPPKPLMHNLPIGTRLMSSQPMHDCT